VTKLDLRTVPLCFTREGACVGCELLEKADGYDELCPQQRKLFLMTPGPEDPILLNVYADMAHCLDDDNWVPCKVLMKAAAELNTLKVTRGPDVDMLGVSFAIDTLPVRACGGRTRPGGRRRSRRTVLCHFAPGARGGVL